MGVLAAIGGLQAGYNAKKSCWTRSRPPISGGYYQANGIKAAVVETEAFILACLPQGSAHAAALKPAKSADAYRQEQAAIQTEAQHLDHETGLLMKRHETL